MAGDNFIAHFPVWLCVSSRLWAASVRPSSPGPDPRVELTVELRSREGEDVTSVIMWTLSGLLEL